MTQTALRTFHLLVFLILLSLPLALVPVVRTMNPPVHSKELAARVLLAVTLVAAVAAWPQRDRRQPDLAEAGLVAVFLAAVLSAALSGRFAYCLLETWHLWVLPLLALAIMRSGASRPFLDKCALIMVLAGVVAGLYGSSVYFGFDVLKPLFPFAVENADARNYIHSFQGNPEYYGSYIAPVAVLALSRVFVPGLPGVRRAIWAVVTVFLLLTLVLSGTRGALGGFALGAAILVLHGIGSLRGSARRAAAGAVGVLAVAAVGLFAILSFPNPLNVRDMRLARRFAELFDVRSDSVKERILFYSVASRMIAANPLLGSGPGTFRLEFYPEVERLVEAVRKVQTIFG
jgi:O-antigen ligase